MLASLSAWRGLGTWAPSLSPPRRLAQRRPLWAQKHFGEFASDPSATIIPRPLGAPPPSSAVSSAGSLGPGPSGRGEGDALSIPRRSYWIPRTNLAPSAPPPPPNTPRSFLPVPGPAAAPLLWPREDTVGVWWVFDRHDVDMTKLSSREPLATVVQFPTPHACSFAVKSTNRRPPSRWAGREQE